MLRNLRSKLLLWNGVSSALGPRVAFEYMIQRRRRSRSDAIFRIHPRWAICPLFGRRGSSDVDVFHQVFIDREYKCLDDLTDVGLIIDCGANVGYSSAYFLSQHPSSRIIAVEPDHDNFAMLRRNLAPYGSRVKLIHAGVWSHVTQLALSSSRYRDGREWSRQVRLSGPRDKVHIDGVDIETLLACSGQNRISILKVDVEGAEAVIFSENCQAWLEKVDAIDSNFGEASKIFFTAIEGHSFDVSASGELTVCRKATA